MNILAWTASAARSGATRTASPTVPGDRVELKVSATAARFSLDITRDGADERTVLEETGIAARWQETPDQCSVEGCGWETTFAFRVGDDWPSGAYRVTLTADGRDGKPIHCHHLFIVAPSPGPKPGRILQVAATGTWLAYNTWGGSNAYEGITGPGRDQYARMVSTQRPWCRGFVVLPPGAPRVPLEVAMPPKTVPRYPHMEWACATGHSKKYASAGWASYDSHFFRWAERAGYGVDLASQHELHFSPEILDGYDCVVFVGHDEYWTWEMRDAVDAYVARGGHAARFAGNFMWQTRLEDEGRRQVCYKYKARAEDPAYRRATSRGRPIPGRRPKIGRPGAKTFGLNSTKGVYAGWGGCTPRGVRGFPVYRPEHWAFAETGLFYGDVLGAESHVYGYEVDGLDYEIRNGRPHPTATSGAPAGSGNPGDGHGQPGRGGRLPEAGGPVLRRRGRPLHRRDALWRGKRREPRESALQQRHDRQFSGRARARCFTPAAANGSPGCSARTRWSSASPPMCSTAI